MAYIRGSQVRPELGAANFGAILAGGQQQAASIQRGMESLGQGIAGGIQQYSATKREDAKTAKMDAEQRKLYEGRIEGAKLQLNAAKLLYGNDPKISAELDAGLKLLDDKAIDPATRAAASEQVVQGIAFLTQKGAMNVENENAAARAAALEEGLMGFARSAEEAGINLPFNVQDIIDGAPTDPRSRDAYLTEFTGVLGKNQATISQMKIAQQNNKGGFDSLDAAMAAGLRLNTKSLSVQQTNDGRWLVQASFANDQGTPEEDEPFTLRVDGETLNFKWNSNMKEYVHDESGLPLKSLFDKSEMMGTTFNRTLYEEMIATDSKKQNKPSDDDVRRNEQGLELQPNTNEPRVTTNEDLASVPANGYFWMKGKNGEWVRKQKTTARR